ncbi:MAG: DUF192 domain-containing protein [Chthoniobacterales bacterium]|nr:DUF192 domain-containing protein [Chthoniobacterales bacterium]
MPRTIFLYLLPFLFFYSCIPSPTQNSGFNSFHELKINNVTFLAQIAITPEEQEQGLMHRANLGKNEGMLFVFPNDDKRAFWMKNTHIPLDVGYFTADGTLQEIHSMNPYDLTPVESQRTDIRFALEMNRGWFEQNNISLGAKLDLNALNVALQRRLAHKNNFID